MGSKPLNTGLSNPPVTSNEIGWRCDTSATSSNPNSFNNSFAKFWYLWLREEAGRGEWDGLGLGGGLVRIAVFGREIGGLCSEAAVMLTLRALVGLFTVDMRETGADGGRGEYNLLE
jgi:hypothetical protein